MDFRTSDSRHSGGPWMGVNGDVSKPFGVPHSKL